MNQAELTADAIATYEDGQLVLVDRNTEPEGLALSGGHHEPGETLETTAIRETREETGLNFVPEYQLGVYDDPGRDPRGQKISVVYAGEAYGEPESLEEATDVNMVPLTDLEDLEEDLVFDHAEVINDFLEGRQEQIEEVSKSYQEPDDLFFLYDRQGAENGTGLDFKNYGEIYSTDDLSEATRIHASNADGMLAATLPVEDHPDISDRYVVGARMDETYEDTSYGKVSDRKTKTRYPAVEVGENTVETAIDALVDKDPEWVKVGAKIDVLP